MSRTKPLTSRRKARALQLKTYYILTDTEQTEKNYFEGLKAWLPSTMRDKMNIRIMPKVKRSKFIEEAQRLIALAEEYSEAWLIFDKDDFDDFDKLVVDANEAGLKTGWSNPCFEIWLFAYFGEMKSYSSSSSCTKALGKVFLNKVGRKYEKSDVGVYQALVRFGDEQRAIDIALQRHSESCLNYFKPSDMKSTSRVYELIASIKNVLA